MNKPKILLINALYIYGGGEYFTFILSKFLKNNGYDVFVSCPEESLLHKKCAEEGIKVFCTNYPKKGQGNLVKNIGELKKIIKNNKIQIVHSNTNYDRTAGAFAAMGTKALHTASIHSFYSIQRNLTHLIRNKYYIKHFIASGKKIRDLLIKEDNIPPEKVTSINLGIDPEEFKQDENSRVKIRKELGIDENDIVIGNAGRMVYFKGQENLIRAYKLLHEDFPNTKLLIVGSGELEKKLKNICEELSLKEKVIFTGFLENLNEIYSAFDTYVHTSFPGTEELFPFAILYALAHSLPIVATNTGEIDNMVYNGINGYLLENNDPVSIKKSLEPLLLDYYKRVSLGYQGLKLMHERFTLEKMGKEIIKVYEKILQ